MSARRLSLVLGAFNVVGALVGSLPACNGVGGLAAQAAFGAKSGAAPMLLGGIKVALGLLFGSSLLQVCFGSIAYQVVMFTTHSCCSIFRRRC